MHWQLLCLISLVREAHGAVAIVFLHQIISLKFDDLFLSVDVEFKLSTNRDMYLLRFKAFLMFLYDVAADIISAVEFDHTGDFLATGDKGGRIVLFQRESSVRTNAKTGIFLASVIVSLTCCGIGILDTVEMHSA